MSRSTGRIYRRGTTYWVDYWAPTGGVDEHGNPITERVRESSGSAKKSDATALLRRRAGEIAAGTYVRPGHGITFEDLHDIIVGDYTRQGRKSVKRLKTSLKHLGDSFGGWLAQNITTVAIDRHVDRRLKAGAAPASVRKEIAALRRAMRLARKRDLMRQLPEFPTLKVDNVRENLPELADVKRICDHLPRHLALPVMFAALTGFRRSNVLGLEWSEVDWSRGEIRLPASKTKNGRGIVFPFDTYPPLRAVLEEAREATSAIQRGRHEVVPLVFHRGGQRIKEFRTKWKAACQAAGVPGTIFHDLRRTAVRTMVEAGLERRDAMRLTGHKTESMFERYNIERTDQAREDTAAMARVAAEKFANMGSADVTPITRTGTET